MILHCAIYPIPRYFSSTWSSACVMHNAAFVSAIMYLVEATGIGKTLHDFKAGAIKKCKSIAEQCLISFD